MVHGLEGSLIHVPVRAITRTFALPSFVSQRGPRHFGPSLRILDVGHEPVSDGRRDSHGFASTEPAPAAISGSR